MNFIKELFMLYKIYMVNCEISVVYNTVLKLTVEALNKFMISN